MPRQLTRLMAIVLFLLCLGHAPRQASGQPGKILAAEAASLQKEANELIGQVVQLHRQKKFKEAEPLARKVLEIHLKLHGPDHVVVALSEHNLAILCRMLGRAEEAEKLLLSSLKTREARLGKDHPTVGQSLDELAKLYKELSRDEEAEALRRRSEQIRTQKNAKAPAKEPGEKPLSAEANRLLKDSHDLSAAVVKLCNQGKYLEAEPLARNALAIRSKILGDDHVGVADSQFLVGWICESRRRLLEAETCYLKALRIREAAQGKDHLDVTQTLAHLGIVYRTLGRGPEAEAMLRRCLSIREGKLGKDHLLVGNAPRSSARPSERGNQKDAIPLLKRSLSIREARQGQGHVDVALSCHLLGVVFMDLGRLAEAESHLQRSLKTRENAWGADDPRVNTDLNELGMLYTTMPGSRRQRNCCSVV